MLRNNIPTLLAFLLAVSLDLGSKILAKTILVEFVPIPLIGHWLQFTLRYNTGVAFGLFANNGSFPKILTGTIIAVLAILVIHAFWKGELSDSETWPFGLVLGGACANFLDRLPDGKVTDFIDVGMRASRWPTSNFADIFITLGVIFLLWSAFLTKSKKEVKS
jgi:signal peptidase II